MELHFFHVQVVAVSLNLNLIRNQLIRVYYVYDDSDGLSVAEPLPLSTVQPTMIVSDDRMADIRNEATRPL